MKKKRLYISPNLKGIILCAIACLLFWWPYEYKVKFFIFTSFQRLSLFPSLLTGFFALFFTICLYVRGIFTIKKDKTSLAAFLINITLFATIFEIFISPSSSSAEVTLFTPISAAITAFAISAIIFGVKEFAKMISLLLVLSILIFRLKLVSDAMGFLGYLAFLCMISGLYLQEAISPKKLKEEYQYLIDKPRK